MVWFKVLKMFKKYWYTVIVIIIINDIYICVNILSHIHAYIFKYWVLHTIQATRAQVTPGIRPYASLSFLKNKLPAT